MLLNEMTVRQRVEIPSQKRRKIARGRSRIVVVCLTAVCTKLAAIRLPAVNLH